MKGFKFAGIPAGIKKNGGKDLGLIYCEQPAVVAALFTRNKVVAAPVLLGKEKIKNGFCQAVLVNSGNANCFTGKKGIEDALSCSKILAKSLGIEDDLVFVSSTGVIGVNLPMDKFEKEIPNIVTQLSFDHLEDFSDAILTTDTHRKVIKKNGIIEGKKFSIMGIAKGSGMIRPDMATMLAFICSDVQISAKDLKLSLTRASAKSFNRITIDGDTSTNDTLLALANNTSGVKINNFESEEIFQKVLDNICFQLAKMVVQDGEGATKLVQIIVKGALTKEDAFKASEAIAHSNLVKTAIYGEDPNWGRIIAAAGRSGAHVVPDQMDLLFDDQPLVIKGNWMGPEAEKKTAQIMKNKEIIITLDLNLGKEQDNFLFCDFSENYVKINAEYRS
ncbi:MAG: bifunctional glutamate N-acetyltransferase/amino-acid acetyltransferase ArgJ [Desulfobacula sp.]|jgi:glutamate N-acetyltransferase/amino-acid N-acetyltransferase|uniref:bifunctional glutamate N-acetyltransferase/amino-acid acetyltransferase ArgJ n=1 Tax=Desulfobacula sp. TaxID=2593537 RepID=UPI001E115FF5|nr:bifunctional glutamate N-acetyltransferase/amino-acid acetyltransferase ArgJ [Desulfobacula sp.]MBT3484429.1 bifunctional glutamate N-acetyltransferase/amino-acid acetyltransferase ArgJ [Desulfobacula sp.]MBT3803344.1 bifunctional glutamate N-acetyltransferase/amino-acid acetyltransferase ArgJ [Desulfobacula sp.]MBT4023689.1 bifunctional glutamate N-acetyltransferase/amino-acid acetyltransferase ArgJ [Desulfobacula sp.]MBT4197931.1 bifunctional glutamate N-acetyltransferase/amino-acid acetyl